MKTFKKKRKINRMKRSRKNNIKKGGMNNEHVNSYKFVDMLLINQSNPVLNENIKDIFMNVFNYLLDGEIDTLVKFIQTYSIEESIQKLYQFDDSIIIPVLKNIDVELKDKLLQEALRHRN